MDIVTKNEIKKSVIKLIENTRNGGCALNTMQI